MLPDLLQVILLVLTKSVLPDLLQVIITESNKISIASSATVGIIGANITRATVGNTIRANIARLSIIKSVMPDLLHF